MQRDVPTGNLPGEAHFPHYGYGLVPYPYMHPYGHYPPHPYPYGGYEPPYRATERSAHCSRSPLPIRSCSKSRGKLDAQGEHGIKRTLFVGLDVDPHTPIPMIPIKAATGLAEEDDVPFSQAFRRKTPVELPLDNVNFKSQLLVFVPFIGVCIPICWIYIYFLCGLQTNFPLHVRHLQLALAGHRQVPQLGNAKPQRCQQRASNVIHVVDKCLRVGGHKSIGYLAL